MSDVIVQAQPCPPAPDLPPESAIPAEMKKRSRWVLWRWELQGKNTNYTKVPINPVSMLRASTNRPGTWSDFEFTYMQARKHRPAVAGIGFVVGDGIFGIDVDKCVEDGRVTTPVAREVLNRVRTYAEYSPSGKGFHLYGLGRYPEGARLKTKVDGQAVECFDTEKFLTITGKRVPGSPEELVNQQDVLLAWHRDIFGETLPFETEESKTRNFSTLDEATVALIETYVSETEAVRAATQLHEDNSLITAIMHSQQRDKFVKLFFAGDISDFKDDSADGVDHSQADYALLGVLAWWTKDPAQLDRMFRKSALCQKPDRLDKWARPKRGQEALGIRMIRKILKERQQREALGVTHE